MIRIVIRGAGGDTSTQEFRKTTVSIGRRRGNDVVIDDPNVSGRHGEVRIYPQGLLYEDLVSTNGSFVRRRAELRSVDEQCQYRVLLEEGDELVFGAPSHPVVVRPQYVPDATAASEGAGTSIDLAETVDASDPRVLSDLSRSFDRAALLALHRFTEQTIGQRNLDALLEHFSDSVLELFPKADRVSVYLCGDTDDFKPVLARDRHGVCPYEPVSRTLRRVVLERGQGVLFAASDRELSDASSLRKSKVSVGLCAPLRSADQTFGFAQVDTRGKLVPFDERDLQVLCVLSRQLALLVDNVRLNRGLHATVRDLERAREEMERLAFEDALTGLANRRLFRDRLEQAMRMGHRSGRQAAVLYLDLDDFKRVNDSLGHDAGDELLRVVAGRLRACVREQDTVARIGGDEFVLLLAEVNGADGALLVAEKALAALREPLCLRSRQLVVTTSIGITLAPDDATDAETLMKNADLALYRAKRRGRDSARFYSEEMKRDASQRLLLESELRQALERCEFLLHYQPVWRFGVPVPLAAEALLRWRHPTRGLLMPDAFIRFAEEGGLIVPISEWVLREACLQLSQIQRSGHAPLKLAVNLSARQFGRGGLATTYERILRDTAVDACALQVELTETMLMENLQESRRTLERLRSLGISVAIDDFGTGYSSLSYLRELPIDTLKIDRRFVHGIGQTDHDREISAAIIAMGHKLGLDVVAEGIETRGQLEFLQSNGCELGQGFLLGRPREFDPAWVATARGSRSGTARG